MSLLNVEQVVICTYIKIFFANLFFWFTIFKLSGSIKTAACLLTTSVSLFGEFVLVVENKCVVSKVCVMSPRRFLSDVVLLRIIGTRSKCEDK
jgi:hypothetical protein